MALIEDISVLQGSTVREAIEAIDRNRLGFALVIDADGKLVGTITDGDVRRGLLREKTLDSPVTEVMSTSPVTAIASATAAELRTLMVQRGIRHIPIIDETGHAVRLHELQGYVPGAQQRLSAVVMAGGEGQRMRPLTEDVPKPMVEVDGKPMLEGVLRNVIRSGVTKVYMAVNYKREVIEAHFGDGSGFGVEIEYVHEEQPLGTAGALSLLPADIDGPFLVINGDVLTESHFTSLFEYHAKHHSVATVAAVEYRVQVPLGVLSLTEHHVLGVEEKPEVRMLCSAGIYVLNPEVLRFVPRDRMFHMTDLINELVREGLPVSAYPLFEQWASIERPADLDAINQSRQTQSNLNPDERTNA